MRLRGLLAPLVGFWIVAAAAAAPDTITLDEIRPGMTGYGLTVFAGSRVDTFAVTVVGVQRNVRAAGSLLVVELAGHGLEVSSIAQGMSGSPVYIDGRFAGALAFGWEGALRPLAGVTPAQEMLALPATAAPAPRRGGMTTPVPGDLAPLGDGGLGAALWGGEPAPDPAPARPLSADAEGMLADLFAAAGLGAAADARDWLYRPLGATAGGASAASTPLAPGSACAVPLVTGDALLGAIGTVTWVDGDRVLMMGHPFLQRGEVDLPLAAAEILTVFPSRAMSFKMGTIGDIVGTVHHDLRAGLAGTLGEAPRLIPVSVAISRGADERAYDFAVVDDPQLTPMLVFWSLYNALLAQGDDASEQTVRFAVDSRWSGDPALAARPLDLSGVTGGPGGVAGLASEWMAPLALLLNNRHAEVRLESVDARLEVEPGDATATITGMNGPREIGPDAREIVYEVLVRPRHGDATTVRVPVDLPAGLAPGVYRVAAASAADLFALEAQRAAATMDPGSLAGLEQLLRRPRSAGDLVVAFFAPGGGLILDGRELTRLPGSIEGLLAEGRQPVDRPLADRVLSRSVATDWRLQSHAVATLEVREGMKPLNEERRP